MSRYVVNIRSGAKYDVYIGRSNAGNKWGNPFIMGKDGDRREVVRKFAIFLLSSPKLVEEARKELKGKVLGCFCAPQLCHGDVLAAVANASEIGELIISVIVELLEEGK